MIFIHQRFLFAVHVVQQSGFEGADFLDFHTFQVTFVRGVQHNTHFSNAHRAVLLLLHQLGNGLTMLQLLASRIVEVGSELGECGQFTVLSQSQTNTATQLLDDLGLGCTTYTGYRHTGVHRRGECRS